MPQTDHSDISEVIKAQLDFARDISEMMLAATERQQQAQMAQQEKLSQLCQSILSGS
ncbi:hypothetical protein [Thalassovita aquimarina]|uniref:Uncharacterized protein n=1 Tax=Thalassovita aquimarina TaxID=2785917 RepID=A0ABS5HQ04_9RHOB|nr:hypothetical protein [Thalassovita aquimarina]MBR9650891.1 hypothetical protein [Thalassovita aquimarina]